MLIRRNKSLKNKAAVNFLPLHSQSLFHLEVRWLGGGWLGGEWLGGGYLNFEWNFQPPAPCVCCLLWKCKWPRWADAENLQEEEIYFTKLLLLIMVFYVKWFGWKRLFKYALFCFQMLQLRGNCLHLARKLNQSSKCNEIYISIG